MESNSFSGEFGGSYENNSPVLFTVLNNITTDDSEFISNNNGTLTILKPLASESNVLLPSMTHYGSHQTQSYLDENLIISDIEVEELLRQWKLSCLISLFCRKY